MSELSIQQIMEHMPEVFVPERAVGVNAVVQCRFSGAEASDWIITIADGKCSVTSGVAPKANLTLNMASQDFIDLVTGKLDGMTAFMQGKIKMSGDISLAMKFTSLFKL